MGETWIGWKCSFNVVVLGDTGVTKTCLCNRCDWLSTINYFFDYQADSVSMRFYREFLHRLVEFTVKEITSLRSLREMGLFPKVHSAIIVYDITRKDSLRIAREWLDILRSEFSSDIFKALAGNKADLVREREVTFEVICFSIGLRQA